jgi:hypothetical protein
MSRKDELLKLAELFHLQALRTGTPAVKQTLHRMGQYYRNEAAHAPDRDSGDPGSSIATLSRLRKPVEFKAPKKLLGYFSSINGASCSQRSSRTGTHSFQPG